MALKKIESKKISATKESTDKKISAYALIDCPPANVLDELTEYKGIRGFRIFKEKLIIPTDDKNSRASLNALEENDLNELLGMSKEERLAYGINMILATDINLELFDKSVESYKGQDFLLNFHESKNRFAFYCLNGSSFKKITVNYSEL